MFTASCHCGAIRLEVAEKPQMLTECTCSICHRTGAQWAYYTRREVRIHTREPVLKAYMWGDKCIEFYHCATCGCTTHYESVEKDPDSRFAINWRMMPRKDIAGIKVRVLDRADT